MKNIQYKNIKSHIYKAHIYTFFDLKKIPPINFKYFSVIRFGKFQKMFRLSLQIYVLRGDKDIRKNSNTKKYQAAKLPKHPGEFTKMQLRLENFGYVLRQIG